MAFNRSIVIGVSAAVFAATAVFAGSHGGNPAVKARKAHMQLYAHNLGALGGMAKGEIDFDAGAAQAAADNLLTLVTMNQSSYWLPGTSNDELGEETRALPAIWADGSTIGAASKAMVDAATAMQAAAGSLEGIQGAIGAVGKSCGGCHKPFRAPNS